MLRSLVGSEMCIRDSINAEYGNASLHTHGLVLRPADSPVRLAGILQYCTSWFRRLGCGGCCLSEEEVLMIEFMEMENLYGDESRLFNTLEAQVVDIEGIPGVREAALGKLAAQDDEFDFEGVLVWNDERTNLTIA
eukprot:TRINITY_DN26679_c0_g1_i6.p1 TRINITY_DN26679_c0_g1~~TRINITY_DN26679_c0_g1_i6.p1  ORF type:complete len:136 (+),score=54.33 TRINITY_DN26679_c0_g1_i6:109-516(+)